VEGDPLEDCTALYAHNARDEILVKLRAEEDYYIDDDPSLVGDGPVSVSWLEVKPVPGRREAVGGQRVLALLQVLPDRLEVATMSRPRLQAAERRLKTVLGKQAQLLSERYRPMAELAGELSGEPEPVAVPPEFAADLKEQFVQRWLSEPVPVLGGLTPRQAVKTVQGRRAVKELLEGIQRRQEQAGPRPGLISPDPRRAKELLGLE